MLGYIAAARNVDRAASQAFIPYAEWVALAGLLNAEIVQRNPSVVEVDWPSDSFRAGHSLAASVVK